MITPRFSCSQSDRSVVVSVYCPAVRASEIEIHVSDTLLSLHVAPYFLRLNFPASLVEDDQSSAAYDPASGYLTLTLTKQNPNENFPDLDLLGKLLAPPPQNTHRGPAIEVLDSQQDTANEFLEGVPHFFAFTFRNWLHSDAAAANDWTVPQTVPDTLPNPRNIPSQTNEVNELGADAETLSPLDRRARRLQHEDSKWDPEHYMADFADSEQIEELLAWTHPYLDPSASSVGDVVFTEAENATMLRLPRREYIASPQETRALYLALVTLLFSYAYDARTTQHDPTPESAWTISALTPAFSALDPPPYPSGGDDPPLLPSPDIDVRELAQSLIPSYRRALAFPLYRSWALAEACRADAGRLLARGTRTVLRCLLEMRAILDAHEVYYVYSRIWLDDFCRWIQACASEDSLKRLGQDVSRLTVSKDSLGWDLVALEREVQAAKEGQSDSDDEEPASEEPAV
ncbi:SHQ1-domain-containing protein [Lactarius psammicola]|nr:SHQ1-domain-containing protein [Lactarius psammicola]